MTIQQQDPAPAPSVLLCGTVSTWEGGDRPTGRYHVSADEMPLFRIVNATAAGLGAAIADDIATIRGPAAAIDRDAVIAHVAAMPLEVGGGLHGIYLIPANHPEMFPGADMRSLADDLHAYCIKPQPLGA